MWGGRGVASGNGDKASAGLAGCACGCGPAHWRGGGEAHPFADLALSRTRLRPLTSSARRDHQRALAISVGAERVLIVRGAIGEEDYVRALARHIGAAFEPFDDVPRYLCPLSDEQLVDAPVAGAAFAATLAGVVATNKTSGFRRSSCAASAGRRSNLPSSYCASIEKFCPST